MSLSLMREVGYDSAFMFKYSERPGTYASKHLPDDVPEDVKIRRLNELIHLQTVHLKVGERVRIAQASNRIRICKLSNQSFLEILRKKMQR